MQLKINSFVKQMKHFWTLKRVKNITGVYISNLLSFTYRLCLESPKRSAAAALLLFVISNAASMHIFSITSVVSVTISLSVALPTNSFAAISSCLLFSL